MKSNNQTIISSKSRRANNHTSQIRVLLLCLMATFLPVQFAEADHYQPGNQVVVINRAELRVGNRVLDDVWPGLVLKITAVQRDWLQLSKGKPGWLQRSNVIPLNRRAIDRLTAMIKADPRNAELYSGRASVWKNLGEIDIAIADLNEAIRLNPTAAYYNNRGIAWRRKGEVDKAISDYAEALRLDPKYAVAFLNRDTVTSQ